MGAIFLPSLTAFDVVCLVLFAESVSDIAVANNTTIGAVGVLRLPPANWANKYVCRWSLHLDLSRLANLLADSSLTVIVGRLER